MYIFITVTCATEADRRGDTTVVLRRNGRENGMAKSLREVVHTVADRQEVDVHHVSMCLCGCQNRNLVDAKNGRKSVHDERDKAEPDALRQRAQIDEARRNVMEMETDSGDKKKIVVGQPLNERFAISQNGKSETIGLALDVTLVPVVMFMSGKGVGLTKKEHDSNTASPTEGSFLKDDFKTGS
ncbi:uncharacterized protein LOC112690752 isoform X3 [Sipha flava]|uniref:Uncharacterized protein LOC112690752 isoform X3 n=1 Tax=Sipha flava TaxID=143950 RepID=A0A8B8GCG1_9HEMI|nr:uncharacterized protein LOC112690752 isoform X3 [Sipha flava]